MGKIGSNRRKIQPRSHYHQRFILFRPVFGTLSVCHFWEKPMSSVPDNGCAPSRPRIGFRQPGRGSAPWTSPSRLPDSVRSSKNSMSSSFAIFSRFSQDLTSHQGHCSSHCNCGGGEGGGGGGGKGKMDRACHSLSLCVCVCVVVHNSATRPSSVVRSGRVHLSRKSERRHKPGPGCGREESWRLSWWSAGLMLRVPMFGPFPKTQRTNRCQHSMQKTPKLTAKVRSW